MSSCDPGCPCSVTEDGRDFGGTPLDSRNKISPGREPSVCRQSLCLSRVITEFLMETRPLQMPGETQIQPPQISSPRAGRRRLCPFCPGHRPRRRVYCVGPCGVQRWRVTASSVTLAFVPHFSSSFLRRASCQPPLCPPRASLTASLHPLQPRPWTPRVGRAVNTPPSRGTPFSSPQT